MFVGKYFGARYFPERFFPRGVPGEIVVLVYPSLLYTLPPSLAWFEFEAIAWYSLPPSLAWWEEG